MQNKHVILLQAKKMPAPHQILTWGDLGGIFTWKKALTRKTLNQASADWFNCQSLNNNILTETSTRRTPIKGASSEYQQVMQTLRHKSYQSPGERPSTSKRSALIAEDDFVEGDDWLEDDVRPTKSKKRKTTSGDLNTRQVESDFVEETPFQENVWELDLDFVNPNHSQRPSTSKRSALIDEDDFVEGDDWLEDDVRPTKSKKRKTASGGLNTRQVESDFVEETPFQEDFWDLDFVNPNHSQRRESTASNESNRSAKKRQISLLDSGFSRERTSSISPTPRGRLSLKQK